MERQEKAFGSLIISNGHIFDIEEGYTGEGYIYKDYDAFKSGEGICYVSEFGLEEIRKNLTDLEARYENGEMSNEEYRVEREKIILEGGETRQTIIDQVWDAWGEEYMLTDEQVEYFARDVFGLAEWAGIATYLAENFELDDCIEFDNIKNGGIFTQFQRDAIANEMSPKEYANRELSYEEYSEICNEFYDAFVVDDECEDDWSENGLGANALITYVDERKTGMIAGPEEFDCDEKWRKFTKR